MSGTLTLTIIKPDAVKNEFTGKIIDQIIGAGFKVKAMKISIQIQIFKLKINV